MKASSFAEKAKFYINPEKLLPLERFLPRPAGAAAPKRGGFGGDRGRGGSRGGSFGGRGGGSFRGAPRGGSFGGGIYISYYLKS